MSRQDLTDDFTGTSNDGGWYDDDFAIRYAAIGAVIAGILLIFFLSYWHARSRLRKGLEPLWYHRWLVRRTPVYYPRPAYGQPHPNDQIPMYNMQSSSRPQPQDQWAPPPPAYNHADVPPQYAVPQGGSKVAPQQDVREVASESNAAQPPHNNGPPASLMGPLPSPPEPTYSSVAGNRL